MLPARTRIDMHDVQETTAATADPCITELMEKGILINPVAYNMSYLLHTWPTLANNIVIMSAKHKRNSWLPIWFLVTLYPLKQKLEQRVSFSLTAIDITVDTYSVTNMMNVSTVKSR